MKNLEPIKKLPVYTRPSINEKKQRCLRDIHYFLFKIKKKKIIPSFEVTKCGWIPFDEVEDKITYPEDKEFFRKIKGEILF